jgi:tyrosyl-tRNA synthetase
VEGGVHAVLAPFARLSITLDEILSIVAMLESAPPEATVVLWLSDWGSFVRNCLGGDMKAIQSSYHVLVSTLTTLHPSTMSRVKVMYQKQTILESGGDYWISVINAGRQHQLQDIVDVEPSNESAGAVVAGLMRCADILALAPTASNPTGCAPDRLSVLGDADEAALTALAVNFARAPASPAVVCFDLRLKQQEGGAGVAPEMERLLVLDSAQDIGSKIKKKAFCEPTNVEFCPPIAIAAALMRVAGAALAIARSPENGGDKEFSASAMGSPDAAVQALEEDFRSGALHPGDLKPAVLRMVDAYLAPMRAALKADRTLKDADAKLKAAAKKAAKGGK